MSEVIRGPVVGQTLGRRAHAAPNTRFPVALDEEKRTKEFRRTRRKRRMKKEEEKENRRQSNRTAEFSISRFDRFGNLQRETLKLSCENTVIFYPTVSPRSFFFFFFLQKCKCRNLRKRRWKQYFAHRRIADCIIILLCARFTQRHDISTNTNPRERKEKESRFTIFLFSFPCTSDDFFPIG